MKRVIVALLVLLLVALMLAALATLAVAGDVYDLGVYRNCRAAGMDVEYCKELSRVKSAPVAAPASQLELLEAA